MSCVCYYILALCGLIQLYFIYTGFRIKWAFNERMRVLDIISKLTINDIENNKDWKWRYDEFDKITDNEMVFKFWKSIKSFYKNSPCIKE